MRGTRRSDEDLLAHAALGLWALEDLPSFRTGVLAHLRQLVDCDLASYNEIGADPGEVFVVADPAETLNVSGGMLEAFAEFVLQNPLAAHCARTGETGTLRLSDFISRRELHALDLYDLVYRHIDTEYQLAFTVPTYGQMIGITLSRAGRDFDERELALLQGARAIVIPAHRNLHDRARLDAILRASDGEAPGQFAVFLVKESGLLQPAHDRAERLLLALSADRSTIDTLRSWARLQRRGGPGGPAPLGLHLPESELHAHYLRGTPGSHDVIAIRLPAESRPQALRGLGLTVRQAEVLHLLWQGETNAGIARALNISEHTVRHHLENIYRQLGVSSRAAAAHVATRTLSG
ncbi:MAG TPA: LuxR C-terminal-related transcriptional regulator [Solirubrobacteraceae bacterium]|nr:LuxR C-terminal-related transcriptional regulator [Solirubrobacteraceae bacterium]